MEFTDKEMEEAREWAKGFVKKQRGELEGKQVGDTLPLKVAGVTFASFKECFEGNPLGMMLKDELFNYGVLIAYSVLKLQEQEKEGEALDKLWGKD